jgi:hypothetical protein
MGIININDIPEDVISFFNESIKLSESNYKEYFSLAVADGSLIKVGPMTRDDAILFFSQYQAGTFPLYMYKNGEEYFAYH